MLWVMMGGVRFAIELEGMAVTAILVGICIAAWFLARRWHHDAVAEKRMRDKQCVECGFELIPEDDICPQCRARV